MGVSTIPSTGGKGQVSMARTSRMSAPAKRSVTVTLDFESRSGTTIGVWGALPSVGAGGTL